MTKPRRVTIEYPGTLPRALGKNRGGTNRYQTAGETSNLRDVGYVLVIRAMRKAPFATRIQDAPCFAKAAIEVTHYWCGTPMDVSGLAAASAPLVDAFVDAGVIEDDSPKYVTLSFKDVRVPHRPLAKIVITVTEVLT